MLALSLLSLPPDHTCHELLVRVRDPVRADQTPARFSSDRPPRTDANIHTAAGLIGKVGRRTVHVQRLAVGSFACNTYEKLPERRQPPPFVRDEFGSPHQRKGS